MMRDRIEIRQSGYIHLSVVTGAVGSFDKDVSSGL